MGLPDYVRTSMAVMLRVMYSGDGHSYPYDIIYAEREHCSVNICAIRQSACIVLVGYNYDQLYNIIFCHSGSLEAQTNGFLIRQNLHLAFVHLQGVA